MIVTTGFGYFKDSNGHVMMKYVVPIGTHPDPTNGLIAVEVANQAALDTITIYVPPPTPAQQRAVIVAQLDAIDAKRPRALSDQVLGNSVTINGSTITAQAYLAQLESQAVTLRAQLAAIVG